MKRYDWEWQIKISGYSFGKEWGHGKREDDIHMYLTIFVTFYFLP